MEASHDHRVVMIAQDDPAAARTMVGWVARRGHDVICVSDAADACTQARRRSPDAVIVDPELGGSGPSLASSMRSDRTLSRIPLVVISPDSGEGFNEDAVGDRLHAAFRAG